MSTTIELPDELLIRAENCAAQSGISLRDFFVAAIEQRLIPTKPKIRRDPPVFGGPGGPPLGVLTPEQVDEAMFG